MKNVGTPYTVYLGRGLYSTYMEAYTLVDSNVRRAMEGMLKTWKEPVPGSMDKRPVFPPEVVRPIENALIKAKTAALQHQRLPQAGYKNTPTPPQMNGQFGPPQGQYAQHQYQRQQHTPQPGQFQPPFQQSTPNQQGAYPYAQPPQQQPRNDAESIKRDLVGIIDQTQRDFASDPSSQKIQQKLKALLDLQQVMNTQQLPPQAMQAVAAQVAQLAVPATPQPSATPPVSSTPQWQPPAQPPTFPFQPPAPFSQPPSAPPPFMQQPPPPMPPFNPQQLGSLAALFQSSQKPTTPQIREAVPSLEKATHAQLHNIQNQPPSASTPPFGNDLLASLTKAGLMKPPSTAPVAPTPPAPMPAGAPPPDLLAMLSTLHKRNPSQNTGGFIPPIPTTASGKPSVPTTNAALKTFRPELLRALYADQPNQCSTCGRRFLSTPEGRANKARHLDWHFRINQRMAEFSASRAAAHRHWFPDAREWMALEDFDASTASAADGDKAEGKAGAAAASKPKGPEDMWIRAPAGVTKMNCPICYEDMRSSHPEELQDWVFMNAVYNNGRAVHATCLQEMTGSVPGLQQAQQAQKAVPAPAQAPPQVPSSLQAALASLTHGAAGMREGSRTPDSMLGKRKAEGDVMGSAEKMRRGGW